MSDFGLQTAGLSGDHGWNDADETQSSRLSTAILVVATSVYWGSVWLLGGLPAILFFPGRVRMAKASRHEYR